MACDSGDDGCGVEVHFDGLKDNLVTVMAKEGCDESGSDGCNGPFTLMLNFQKIAVSQ